MCNKQVQKIEICHLPIRPYSNKKNIQNYLPNSQSFFSQGSSHRFVFSLFVCWVDFGLNLLPSDRLDLSWLPPDWGRSEPIALGLSYNIHLLSIFFVSLRFILTRDFLSSAIPQSLIWSGVVIFFFENPPNFLWLRGRSNGRTPISLCPWYIMVLPWSCITTRSQQPVKGVVM